jgi:phage terminase large subunit-like protein
MSKPQTTYVGYDFGFGSDYTAMTLYRRPNWFERLLRKLHLSKATWELKLIRSEVTKSNPSPREEEK